MKHLSLPLLFLFAVLAHGEIYEIIDENGNKSYTDTPPANETKAKPITVNPDAGNAWQKDETQDMNDRYYRDKKMRREKQEQARKALMEDSESKKMVKQQTVEEAEKALEQALEVNAGDFYKNNKTTGGIRYTQDYLDRVKKAEADLERARQAAGEE